MHLPTSRPRAATALLGVVVLALVAATPAPLDANPWLERRVLNIAHQGGEIEAPSDTLFALKTAVAKGSDVLEIDVHATSDGEIVVLHDTTVDRTTDGEGRVDATTLEEIEQLDAAYWFVPDCGTCHDQPVGRYRYRGYATGDRQIPAGLHQQYGLDEPFTPNDFTIPTLREVLKTFPDTLINIEIKNHLPHTTPYVQELVDLLSEVGRTDDVIVVSFLDHAVEHFKALAPEVHTATATAETAAFWASAQGPLPGAPNPRYQALQVPIEFEGQPVVTREFVARAHANGLAVHVWTINDVDAMRWLIGIGVDGIMTDRPTLLEELLAEYDIRY